MQKDPASAIRGRVCESPDLPLQMRVSRTAGWGCGMPTQKAPEKPTPHLLGDQAPPPGRALCLRPDRGPATHASRRTAGDWPKARAIGNRRHIQSIGQLPAMLVLVAAEKSMFQAAGVPSSNNIISLLQVRVSIKAASSGPKTADTKHKDHTSQCLAHSTPHP